MSEGSVPQNHSSMSEVRPVGGDALRSVPGLMPEYSEHLHTVSDHLRKSCQKCSYVNGVPANDDLRLTLAQGRNVHRNRDGLSLSRFAHLTSPSITGSEIAFAVPGALQIPCERGTSSVSDLPCRNCHFAKRNLPQNCSGRH